MFHLKQKYVYPASAAKLLIFIGERIYVGAFK